MALDQNIYRPAHLYLKRYFARWTPISCRMASAPRPSSPPQVELSVRLGELEAAEQLKGLVPLPIHDRAEHLVELLVQELRNRGLRTASRGDLLAALIHAAPKDGRKLADKLVEYRADKVWQTLGTKKRRGRVRLRPRRSGRPSR